MLPHVWDQGQGRWRCRRCGMVVNPQRVDVTTLPACRLRPTRPEPQPLAIPDPIDRPGKLAAIACYFNPAGFSRLKANYQRFVHEFPYWGIPLYVAEVAFGDAPYVDLPAIPGVHIHRITAADRHILWQKERLLNLAETLVPADYDSLAWIDADCTFLSPTWAAESIEALRRYRVVQLFDRWHYLGPHGEIQRTVPSVGQRAQRYVKPDTSAERAAMGGAWVARRECCGLYDRHVVGGGDTSCLDAWVGRENPWFFGQMSSAWFSHWNDWRQTAFAQVDGSVSAISGDIIHHYHGSVGGRNYARRSLLLKEHHYDPATHVAVDAHGLLTWTDAAPAGLRAAVRDYFTGRREDD